MRRLIGYAIMIIILASIPIHRYIESHQLGHEADIIYEDEFDLEPHRIDTDIPNTSIYSYRVDIDFESTKDVVTYLKLNEGNGPSDFGEKKYDLGTYRDSSCKVDWIAVENSIEVSYRFWNKIYVIEYEASFPESNTNELVISVDGYILDLRSSGK